MTAYWISTYFAVTDDAKMKTYADLAGPALIEAGGTFLARGKAQAFWENGMQQRTVLIEFASVEAAVTAHESEAYQAALAALDGGAERDLRVVAGIEPPTRVDRP